MKGLGMLLGLLLAVSGCSSLPWASDTEGAAKAKVVAHVPTEPGREAGSLWSEGSRWNSVFDSAPFRNVGDSLRIEVTDFFARKIAEESGGKGADKKGERAKTAEAAIVEMLPKGVYRVQVASFNAGPGFSGLVREKDIGAGDSVRGESLFNFKLDGKGSSRGDSKEVPPTPAAGAGPKSGGAS